METVVTPMVPQIEQQQSIVNFLASVVAEAESIGLGYEKIFNSTVSTFDNNQRSEKARGV